MTDEEEPEEERPQVLRICEECGTVMKVTQWVRQIEGKMICFACWRKKWG